jgi:hypothetical protein
VDYWTFDELLGTRVAPIVRRAHVGAVTQAA